ncbi:hypothetical protein HanRHA438_Chr10g0470551 [Helianthus annuus]|nr:hypothetical protein HanRHA438_Chr10g0470551 [Helianthus annuus]
MQSKQKFTKKKNTFNFLKEYYLIGYLYTINLQHFLCIEVLYRMFRGFSKQI